MQILFLDPHIFQHSRLIPDGLRNVTLEIVEWPSKQTQGKLISINHFRAWSETIDPLS